MRLSGKLPATAETRRKQQPEVIEAPCCSNRSSATLHVPVRLDLHNKNISGIVMLYRCVVLFSVREGCVL